MPVSSPSSTTTVSITRDDSLFSFALQRAIRLEVVLPPEYDPARAEPYPVLYMNDGQDLWRLRLPATLGWLYRRQVVQPFVLVAVHADERIQEYGVAGQPDYLGRGSRADQYGEFVRQELLPYIQQQFHVSANPSKVVWAGCSLGGLTAFDIVWRHPEIAARAGAFSPSFWWRRRAIEDGYTYADGIMHSVVRASQPHSTHRFWLQTGTNDETNDRNNNGIIDSIEDTLDLMATLVRQGLPESAVRYVEVIGGRHNQRTWSRLMPDFLRWAFPAAGFSPLGPPLRTEKEEVITPWRSRQRMSQRRHKPVYSPHTIPTSSMSHLTARPVSGEYAPYYDLYIQNIPAGHDPLQHLREQPLLLKELLADFTEEQGLLRYAPGKWSIKEMLVHIIDTERIFAYRALRIARGDQQPLPGFEQDDYVPASGADDRTLESILHEYDTVRAATLSLFESLRPEAYERVGIANNTPTSVRALAYILPGHEAHHLHILQDRYLSLLVK